VRVGKKKKWPRAMERMRVRRMWRKLKMGLMSLQSQPREIMKRSRKLSQNKRWSRRERMPQDGEEVQEGSLDRSATDQEAEEDDDKVKDLPAASPDKDDNTLNFTLLTDRKDRTFTDTSMDHGWTARQNGIPYAIVADETDIFSETVPIKWSPQPYTGIFQDDLLKLPGGLKLWDCLYIFHTKYWCYFCETNTSVQFVVMPTRSISWMGCEACGQKFITKMFLKESLELYREWLKV
jgi:hypothetical protein